MRNTYRGYYKKSPQEIKLIWTLGLITFDANVLLNLYRYSSETRLELINLIGKLSTKVFLTHQAGVEFHKNRLKVIEDQIKAYKNFGSELSKIEESVKAKYRQPIFSKKIQSEFSFLLEKVRNELGTNQKFYNDQFNQDNILNEVTNLFNGKIESDFSQTELDSIKSEAKKRFENKIPPGYEDEKNKNDERQIGDLVLWKQIIKKAKLTKQPIIFVTDDNKKDWWWKLNDENIGARPELIEEIYREAGVEFQILQTQEFLRFGPQYLKEESNEQVIEEVIDVKESFVENHQEALRNRLTHLVGFKEDYMRLVRQLYENDNPSEQEIRLIAYYTSKQLEIDLEIIRIQQIISKIIPHDNQEKTYITF